LTGLLGSAVQPKPNNHRQKQASLPQCAENTEPNDNRTLPTKQNEDDLKNAQGWKATKTATPDILMLQRTKPPQRDFLGITMTH